MIEFFDKNSIYIVLGIVLIIWAGLSMYLFNVDKKVQKLEKLIETNE
ncbi:MAG: CcmD family protein [Candidatus Kapabacteria bacterium]|nr:CcmD family protein [Candidatus Kapabacteria bacterium]